MRNNTVTNSDIQGNEADWNIRAVIESYQNAGKKSQAVANSATGSNAHKSLVNNLYGVNVDLQD